MSDLVKAPTASTTQQIPLPPRSGTPPSSLLFPTEVIEFLFSKRVAYRVVRRFWFGREPALCLTPGIVHITVLPGIPILWLPETGQVIPEHDFLLALKAGHLVPCGPEVQLLSESEATVGRAIACPARELTLDAQVEPSGLDPGVPE